MALHATLYSHEGISALLIDEDFDGRVPPLILKWGGRLWQWCRLDDWHPEAYGLPCQAEYTEMNSRVRDCSALKITQTTEQESAAA